LGPLSPVKEAGLLVLNRDVLDVSFDVAVVACVAVVGDAVKADVHRRAGEGVRGGPGTQDEHVVVIENLVHASPARHDIGAVGREQRVVSVATAERVVTAAAVEVVDSGITREYVVAGASLQLVVPGSTIEGGAARAGAEEICPGTAVEGRRNVGDRRIRGRVTSVALSAERVGKRPSIAGHGRHPGADVIAGRGTRQRQSGGAARDGPADDVRVERGHFNRPRRSLAEAHVDGLGARRRVGQRSGGVAEGRGERARGQHEGRDDGTAEDAQ
jgi:hypothetical protein